MSTVASELEERQNRLIQRFSKCHSWEDRYKLIIEAGRTLAPYPETKRLDNFKVRGCQSQVWLYPEIKDGKIVFWADSDALITKGLVALLLELYSDAPPKDIVVTKPSFIQALGLDARLTPSRSNGLFSMIQQIKLFAAALAVQAGISI